MCVLIDVCVQLLLYMFRGEHKIIPQHSRSKSSTKPPSPFWPTNLKWRLVRSCSHVFPSQVGWSHPVGHSEIHTLWALHNVFWPAKPVHGLVTTAITWLRQLKTFVLWDPPPPTPLGFPTTIHGVGMDVFWNHTICNRLAIASSCEHPFVNLLRGCECPGA